jgi:DNA-binding transcriptional regulator of glucitol operon
VRAPLKTYLTPGWVLVTVLAWGGGVGMVLLGRWQLDVSNTKHFDLQNFGYALQWWAFTIAALLFWAKAVRDAGRVDDTVGASGQVVLSRGPGGKLTPLGVDQPPVLGSAHLISPYQRDGEPVVYRGYVMPQSAITPARSEGDPMHEAYNDYLWQLGQADGAPGTK